jgi:hypothetical protein
MRPDSCPRFSGAGSPFPFLEVALETSARILVTGNLKHFPAACRGPVTVLPPRSAWERFVALSLS